MIMISNITKKYKKHTILNDVSLTLHPGECVGITGANGSGKTTLLSIIVGYLPADSGHIVIDGHIYPFDAPELRHLIGYVPQENPLIPELSVYDNLRLWYADSPLNLETELADGFLHSLGIQEYLHKKAVHLSGGMQKRLSLGIAMANQPSLLVMDEPLTALDIPCKKEIRAYTRSFCSQGGTVLLVSHDEAELKLCDQLYELRDGTLIPTDASKL